LIALAAASTTLAVPGAGVVGWVVTLGVTVALLARHFRLLGTADAVNREACARFTAGNVTTVLIVYLCWSVVACLLRLS
jgi:hypothetical protein